MRFICVLSAATLCLAVPANAETLDNQSVVELVNVGLSEAAIIAKIESSSNQFEVATRDLVTLKKAGVPSDVIAAMIGASKNAVATPSATASFDSPDPLVPHPAGVYMLADWLPQPKMLAIDATTSNQTKTGGFLGYALTGGLAPMSFKAVIPNAQARIRTAQSRPTFFFYFDEPTASSASRGGSGFWRAGAVSSPAEFSLVAFKVKSDRREAKVGQFNLAGAKAGVMDKDRIPFEYERVAPGVFKVMPQATLAPGEYGFIYATSGGSGPGAAGVGATTSRIFDFSVEG